MSQLNKRNLHLVVDHLLALHGERLALEQEGGGCSYRDLDRRSAALAALLRARGVQPGDVVALPMGACIDYVAALLAVVRCDAIFMPLDAAFPPARLQRMLALAPPRAVVGNDAGLVATIAAMTDGAAAIVLGTEALAPAEPPPCRAGDDDTGYLIATSGSTGEPKLVAGRNKGISHFVHWEVAEFGIDQRVRASFLAPPTFDVSLREIFVPLLAGGTLVIPPPTVRADARRLARWLREQRISLLHCVPSLLRLLTRALRDGAADGLLPDLALVATAGEPLYGADVAAWRQAAGPAMPMVNLYGPSETTLAKAFHRIGDDVAANAIVPLGRAISNAALLVLRDGRLCGTGEIGELHVHTPFASNGYWGRPDLTAQAFVPNPLAPDAGQAIYRSGDLARYRADGCVEFVGRSDRQVKIAGVRIELPEIELAMRSHPGVIEAVAHPFRLAGGENCVVGYYTAEAPLAPLALREAMRGELPEAMLPAWLVQLDEFPRNLNGKVDRRALPRPQELLDTEVDYVAPEGELEQALALLWADALGLQRVGATQPWLLLGGNSMRAIGLIGRIGQRLAVDLTIREFFEAGTVRALAARIAARQPQGATTIERAPPQRDDPLTPAQAGLWLLDRVDGAATLYNNVEWLELRGTLDARALADAFDSLVARHPALRTAFGEVDGEPRQRVLASIPFTVHEEASEPALATQRLHELLRQERQHRFDLGSGRLLRAHLLRLGPEHHHLVINMHHIACDGWSMALLVRELADDYRRRLGGAATAGDRVVEGEQVGMRDLAHWLQARPVATERIEAWRTRLADADQRAMLPPDPEPDAPGGDPLRAGRVSLALSGAALAALRAQLAQQGATTFMGVAAALAVLLYRHGSSETVVIGTPLAGRSRGELRHTVGFLVNTLPLVLRPFAALSFAALLDRTRHAIEDLSQHEFDTPVQWVATPAAAADPARNPFHDVLLAMEPVAPAVALPGLELLEHEVPQPAARNDLSLRLRDAGDSLVLLLEYRRTLYAEAGMAAMLRQLARLLEHGAAEPALQIAQLQMLDAAERASLHQRAQGPSRPLPAMTIDRLFAHRAAAAPHAIAIVTPEASVSYGALQARAERIASALQAAGVRPGDVVGVLLEREPDWIAAVLAVFQNGAIYLPLDPWHPPARHAALLGDAGARLLLACGARELPCAVLDLATLPANAPEAILRPIDAGAPAYLIYTSGSTGAPKGVLVSHGAVANMILDQAAALEVAPSDTVLQFFSPAFDVSMFELFLALLSGARLALADRHACGTPQGLADAVARLQVTVLATTPGFLNSLGELPLPGLRTLVVGGEAPIAADLQRRLDQGIRIVHHYGPTEAAVCASFEVVAPGAMLPQPLPLGRPTANTALHVVAPDLSPLPIGAIGELAIAGPGLALGYRLRPADTEAAFPTRSQAAGEARLYRTGDRVRRRADGALVFVGRKDSQVKIRGHRVELGEVEAALRQQPGVADARVLARAVGQDQELVAWWSGAATDAQALRAALEQRLPEYMVPRTLQRLDALPLTANGKLDPQRLPLATDPATAGATEPPRDDQERSLAALWSELLGCDAVGRDANFFELGGRSLAANRLALRASRALGRTVDLRDIYAAPTPASLVARLRAAAADTAEPLPRLPEQTPAPLSPMQRRLWVVDQLGDSGAAYHIAALMRLEGELDAGALRAAFDDLAARHAVLRTRFVAGDGEPLQVCDRPGPVPWTLLSGLDAAALQPRLEALAAQPFELARQWPLRVVLAAEGGQRWQLLVVLHHIAADGWSMPILEADLARAYAARRRGAAPDWPSLPAQYRDVAAWMQQRLDAGAHADDRDYWLARLQAPLPLLELPTDRPRPTVRRFAGATVDHVLEPPALAAAQQLAGAHGTSLFAVLLAALQTLLHRLSGQDDLVIGVPVAGRPHPASEALVGFFVNTLPLRERIDGQLGFGARLAAASASLRQGMAHQGYPFDRLVGELRLERDTSRSALFDVMIGLDEPAPPAVLEGLAVQNLPLATRGARCDLTWLFSGEGGAQLRVEFDTALFDRPRIADWVRRFELLLVAAAAEPSRPLARLELVSAEERAQLLQAAAAPATAAPDTTVLALFEAQVAAHAREVALRTDHGRWSYGELDACAGQLASELLPLRRRPDTPVALVCGRGPLMVIAQLAVLKCGAAYLPIEPDAPPARARLLLEDSGADLLLFDPDQDAAWLRDESAGLPRRHPLVLPGRRAVHEADARYLAAASSRVGPDDPVYVMYTSGSTGRPKGVLTPHRGVVRLVRDGLYYDPRPGDRLLQLSNYAFDGATFDFYAALANGLSLCIPEPGMLLDPQALAAFVRRHEVNVTFITTALFNRLVDETPQVLRQFRRLYFGGQQASLPHVRRALALMTPGALVHVYGPTEATTFASWHTVVPADVEPQALRLPIGRPIGQTELHVLDAAGMLVPPGTPGELCIGGAGLALGYLGQPELTAERFVASPFTAGARLYRTGDLCLRRPDGAIDFLGRIDGQVKVRGFRVEPGEVEHHLATHPAVGKVHVLPRRNDAGNTELVAYFTAARAAAPLALDDLREHLERVLPRYMVPAHFVLLDALPLNRNGKVDRTALPAPETVALAATPGATDGLSASEQALRAAWAEVLGRDDIGVDDNYYALGGDSIQAIQIGARLRERGFQLKVTDLLRHPTIARLAPLLGTAAARPREQAQATELALPLTPIQHWLLDRYPFVPAHFNQSVLLRLPAGSDAAAVQRALAALQERHGALRLRFGIGADGRPWQTMAPPDEAAPSLTVHDCRGSDGAARMQEAIAGLQRSVLPATGPLWAAGLFRLDDGDRLLLTVHHWAVDGVSWRILLEDFGAAWSQAAEEAAAIELPAATDSLLRWSQALHQAAASGPVLAQRPFWQQQLSASVGALPRLAGAAAAPLGERLRLQLELDEAQTEALFGSCHAAYRTRSDELLLAAWVRALTRVQGHASCRILLESHGREALEGSVDVGRTVGWFTATYPLVFTLEGDDWSRHIREVKETLRAVPARGIGFGLLRHLGEPRLAAGAIESVFNYLGRFEHREQPLPIADESTGDELDPALALEQGLDLSAEVRDGRLRLQLVGDCARHPAWCFHALRDALAEALQEVIAHCRSPHAGALSPSDVDLPGIGIADLDQILAGLERP